MANVHVQWNLSADTIDQLKNAYDIYMSDRAKIAKRVASYTREHFDVVDPGRSRKNLSGMDELLEKYASEGSEPPTMLRLSFSENEGFRWGQRDIAVIINRDVSSVSRNLHAMENSHLWHDRLVSLRRLTDRGSSMKIFLYNEGIFDLFLDFYAYEYILHRIIRPRHGGHKSDEMAAEAWRFWDYMKHSKDQQPAPLSLAAESAPSLFDEDLADGCDNGPDEYSWRSLIKEFWAQIMHRKTISLAILALSQFIDLSRRMASYFYYIPFVLLPLLAVNMLKIRNAKDSEKRQQYLQAGAFISLFLLLWAVSFSGRLASGDMSKSMLSDLPIIKALQGRLDVVEKKQEDTEKAITKIDEKTGAIEAQLQKENADLERRSEELIEELRTFVRECSEDNKKMSDSDYERQITLCDDMLLKIGRKSLGKRADLYLRRGDVYAVWGMSDRETSLAKFSEARKSYTRALEDKKLIPPSAIGDAYIGLAAVYQLEADIREKHKNLDNAEMCYKNARPYISKIEDKHIVSMYYCNYGNLYAAMAEALQDVKLEQEADYIKRSIKKFLDGLSIAGISRHDSQELLYGLAMSYRKLAHLELTLKNYPEAKNNCEKAIATNKRIIKGINLEREQRDYAGASVNLGTAYLQTFDVLRAISGDDKNTLLRYLSSAEDALKNANEFNGGGKYFNGGIIPMRLGMLYYRRGLLTKSAATFDRAVKYYDDALKNFPVSSQLYTHLEIAANKGTTMFNAARTCGGAARYREVIKLGTDYLNKYSQAGYKDIQRQFIDVVSDSYLELAKYEDRAKNLELADKYRKLMPDI